VEIEDPSFRTEIQNAANPEVPFMQFGSRLISLHWEVDHVMSNMHEDATEKRNLGKEQEEERRAFWSWPA
jgi:hypothetical protein